MKVGVCEAVELKKRSTDLEIPFADLLRGYVIEDMMIRISSSGYRDFLWLKTVPVIGKDCYIDRSEKSIRFLYVESEKKSFLSEKEPGQKLTGSLTEQMIPDIFEVDNSQKIQWTGKVMETDQGWMMSLLATYCEMQVPVSLFIQAPSSEVQRSKTRKSTLIAIPDREITYVVCASESQLSKNLYLIMERLELVGDMKVYYEVYQILKNDSLSGRYVLEELTELTENNKMIRTETRLEQIKSYHDYSYMRKRWEKYLKNHRYENVSWQEALELIVSFIRPIWHCLCEDEIFFDDWMPELGRFLD